MRKSKNILLLILFLLCGVISYGQFSLNANGVTIECPGVAFGTSTNTISGVVGPKTYWAVNSGDINQFLNTGSFDADGSSHTPPDLSCVCTTGITEMDALFENRSTFNQDISNWDTSNVTNMQTMFKDAAAFNQDISNWDVSSVTNMGSMFRRAKDFNQDISGWDTGSVRSMAFMFAAS